MLMMDGGGHHNHARSKRTHSFTVTGQQVSFCHSCCEVIDSTDDLKTAMLTTVKSGYLKGLRNHEQDSIYYMRTLLVTFQSNHKTNHIKGSG